MNKKIKEPIIIPYNPNNKLIKDVDIKEMLDRFGVKVEITDIELYRQSLTHKSYIKKEFYEKNMDEIKKYKNKMNNVLELRDKSNERLEYFGDTVIKTVIAEYLFESCCPAKSLMDNQVGKYSERLQIHAV